MLRFIDGFDHHNSTTLNTYNKWNALQSIANGNSDTIRRFIGDGQYLSATSTLSYMSKELLSNEASGIFGMAVRFSGTGTAYTSNIFMLYDSSSKQLVLRTNSDRTFSLYRDTTLLATSTYQFAPDTWFYVEFKWKISSSIASGDVVVFVDDVAILTLAAGTNTQNTSNAYATALRLHNESGYVNTGNTNVYFDDFYWCDLTGSNNNAPLGPVRVSTLTPTGNGNYSQLVNNSGNSTNNYQRVDEIPPNTDTDYVGTSTPGNKDTYAFSDTPATTTTIYGVAVNSSIRKTDSGARTYKNQVRISSTDYEGTEKTPATNYTNQQEIFEVSPATSSAWTKSEVDGAEFGIKCHA